MRFQNEPQTAGEPALGGAAGPSPLTENSWAGEKWIQVFALIGLAVASGGVSGCSKPPAIENNLKLAQPDMQPRKVLTAGSLSEEDDWRERQQREKDVLARTDQERILDAMRMVGEGMPPPDGSLELVPATHGVRWSDVYLSVYNAALEDGVDLGMLSYDEQPWGWTFRFKTLDNKPAEMVVRRADPPVVYRATASVGRWAEDAARATRLLEAFDAWMKKYGKKPGTAE